MFGDEGFERRHIHVHRRILELLLTEICYSVYVETSLLCHKAFWFGSGTGDLVVGAGTVLDLYLRYMLANNLQAFSFFGAHYMYREIGQSEGERVCKNKSSGLLGFPLI